MLCHIIHPPIEKVCDNRNLKHIYLSLNYDFVLTNLLRNEADMFKRESEVTLS